MAPASSPPVSWNTNLIGVPLMPPRALRSFSANLAPMTCSWPSSAVLLVWATATPIGTGIR